MKIHRFIDNFDLTGLEVEITGEIAHQMVKVLKLEIGEQVELCDGKGISAMAEIESLNKNMVKLKLGKISRLNLDKEKVVSLFCAVLKKENFELVVQKVTECGVDKIIPIITTRTIKMGLNMERLQKIAREACEQSHRSILPEILEPMSFEESLELAKENDVNIIFDASGEVLLGKMPCERDGANTSKNSSEFYGCILNNKTSPGIWIGPEGGWTPEEIKKATENNFSVASLGKNVLRAETAAIIGTFLVAVA
ncbi:MAG: RsmE family RNA methyltransferase [Candidatus Nomurabacteria bacterium]|nr:RsmE family RNA methyltransferase [Candidatus Nomurabacteria bacterium]